MKITNKEKTTAYFQDLIGIIKIGLKDTQMRENETENIGSALGCFSINLKKKINAATIMKHLKNFAKKNFHFHPAAPTA